MDWSRVRIARRCDVQLLNITTHRRIGLGVQQLITGEQASIRCSGVNEKRLYHQLDDEDEDNEVVHKSWDPGSQRSWNPASRSKNAGSSGSRSQDPGSRGSNQRPQFYEVSVSSSSSSSSESDSDIRSILEDNKRKLRQDVERSRKKRKYYTEVIEDSDSDIEVVIETRDMGDTSPVKAEQTRTALKISSASNSLSSGAVSRGQSVTLSRRHDSESLVIASGASSRVQSAPPSRRGDSESKRISSGASPRDQSALPSRDSASRVTPVSSSRASRNHWVLSSRGPSIRKDSEDLGVYSGLSSRDHSYAFQQASSRRISESSVKSIPLLKTTGPRILQPLSDFSWEQDPYEEKLIRNFERMSNVRMKKLAIDVKEEHLFVNRIKRAKLSLVASRDKIRRLFSSQKKGYDERIMLPSIYWTPGFSDEFPCLFRCGAAFSRFQTKDLALHMSVCPYRTEENDEDDEILPDEIGMFIPEVEIDGEPEPEPEPVEEEEKLNCPRCGKLVEDSLLDLHMYMHLPYPCLICIHRYDSKTDIEDHIINQHATHFMAALKPVWRREPYKPITPYTPHTPLAPRPPSQSMLNLMTTSFMSSTGPRMAVSVQPPGLPRASNPTIAPSRPTLKATGRYFVKDSAGNYRELIFVPSDGAPPPAPVANVASAAVVSAANVSIVNAAPSRILKAVPSGTVKAAPGSMLAGALTKTVRARTVHPMAFTRNLPQRGPNNPNNAQESNVTMKPTILQRTIAPSPGTVMRKIAPNPNSEEFINKVIRGLKPVENPGPRAVDKDGAPVQVDDDGAPLIVQPKVLDPIVHDVF